MAVNCSTSQAMRRLAPLRARIIGYSPSLFPQRTTRHAENFFSARDFQIALPRRRNPIILEAKAGIDPVGASCPKVICPP
jgi:hypothetical protein